VTVSVNDVRSRPRAGSAFSQSQENTMSEKIEAIAQRTFLHDFNKTVRRGDPVAGSKAVIHQLEARGLVQLKGPRAAEQAKGESADNDRGNGHAISQVGGDAVVGSSTGDQKAKAQEAGELLVSGSAADSVTRVKEAKDLAQLEEAQAAEQAKGDGARKTVLDALAAAIAAFESPKA